MQSLNQNEVHTVSGGVGTALIAAVASSTTFALGTTLGYYLGISSCASNLLASFTSPTPLPPSADTSALIGTFINDPNFPNNIGTFQNNAAYLNLIGNYK